MKRYALWMVAIALALLVALPVAAGDGSGANQGDDKKEQLLPNTFEFRNGEPGNVFFSSGEPFELGAFLGKGFLGVGLTDLTPELRAHYAESEDAGVLVNKVTDGSPAAQAGIRVGDVITAVDGEPVKGSLELTRVVRKREPGERVSLELFRDGRRQILDVSLAERERATVDLGDHLFWKRDGEGEPWAIRMDGKLLEELPEGLMDRVRMDKLGEALEGIDWQAMADGFGPPNEDLEKRLEALEERIEKMVEELSRQYGADGEP